MRSCRSSRALTTSMPYAPSAAGFAVLRQGKHVILSNGQRKLSVPRANPINAITMGGLVRDAGLTIEEFKKLL